MAEPAPERLERARAVLTEATRVAAAREGSGGATSGSSSGVSGDAVEERPKRTARKTRVGEDSDPESLARSIALRLLNHSARSRGQLGQAMAREDVPEDVANRVLDRFEEVGLLDDAEFAAMLVRTRVAERGLAKKALAVELRRKGIDAETMAYALDEVDPAEEEAVARALVQKRLRSMGSLDTEVKRRRLLAMLGRKGHEPSLCYRVVDAALADSGR